MERLKNYKTSAFPEIDKNRGFNEIINSPIYKKLCNKRRRKNIWIFVYLKER